MATLSGTKIVLAGVVETLAAAASGGDQFANRGKSFVVVTNVNVSDRTVTFDSPNADEFGVIGASHDIAVVVSQNEFMMIGPFSTAQFNDGNGFVQMTYTTEVDLTVQVLEFPAVD